MSRGKQPYRPHLKRRLSDTEIEKRFNYLVEIGHPKIVKENKTLEYFKKIENRPELISAYTSSRDNPAARNKPGFDPEKVGYSENVNPETHKLWEKKLNSSWVTSKTRNRYNSALDAVRKNGGMNAPPRLLKALHEARKSVTSTYATKMKNELTREARAIQKTNPELLSDKQKELIRLYEGRESRRATVGKKERRERGLRSQMATLESQQVRLNETKDTFVKRLVRDGYEAWLKDNPDKFRLGADGKKLTGTAQSQLYWDLLPEWEKQNWYDEVGEIYEDNLKIIKKYHDKGKIVPYEVQANKMKQLHHILPRKIKNEDIHGSVRGGHFPSQTVGLKGDAFKGRGSPHGRVHEPGLDYLYGKFNDQNHMVFDFNDPKVVSRSGGQHKPNVKGLSYLKDVATSLMNMKGVRPVLKTAAKAIPIAGYGAAAKGAVDYGEKHPILSTISGLSAVPGFGDVFGLPLAAAELGGLVINRDLEVSRERKKKRGLLDYIEPKRYRAFNRLRD